jgi:MFS family permease
VYTSVRTIPATAAESRAGEGRIGSNVFLLGLVSLFTDLAQEMVTAVLPLYVTFQLGIGALGFGLLDGLYQGSSAFLRLIGGLAADRGGRHKQVAASGYGLSTVSKFGLVASAGSFVPFTGFLVVDRLGKGIRTAPRDAMISLSADEGVLGRAFGIHRTLDTVGALLGPLAAFVLLSQIPHGYTTIFVVSAGISVIGLAILLLFVQNPKTAEAEAPAVEAPKVSARMAVALLRRRDVSSIVIAGSALGLMTISDGFVYLVLQHNADLNPRWFPLLYLGTALVYLLLALPFGNLADRVGRARVFLGGYAALVAMYVLLLSTSPGALIVLACLGLLGAYYAATDGVLMALATTSIPERLRTSGFAIVTTATSTSRLVGSIAFGAIWAAYGPEASVHVFLVGLAVALPLAAVSLRRGLPKPA